MTTTGTATGFLNARKPLHWSHWWHDLVLWLFIGLVLAWQLPLWIPKAPQAIMLRFKDSSELSAGSPVRLMGTEVGWVHNVRFKKDHVQVKLRFYRDSPHIPPGSEFTIEFTGIAGAKCVEITPPDALLSSKPASNNRPLNAHRNGRHDPNHYVVVEPIRMADVQQGGLLQVDAMKEGAENTARLLDPDSNTTEYNLAANRRLLQQVNRSMANGTNVLTGARGVTQRIENGLHNTSHNIASTFNDYSHSLNTLNTDVITNTPKTLPKQLNRLRQTNQSVEKLRKTRVNASFNVVIRPAQLAPLRQASQSLPHVTSGLHAFNNRLNQLNNGVPLAAAQLEKTTATMAHIRQQVETLSQTVHSP
jgi:hypothetical protein